MQGHLLANRLKMQVLEADWLGFEIPVSPPFTCPVPADSLFNKPQLPHL